MKKFDVLKAITDEEKFSDMVFDLIEVKKTPEALAELLKEEMPEKELPHLKEAALNGYPLELQETRVILTPTKITDGCVGVRI